HWEGDVLLGVVIRASGSASITVKRSSQYEVLDRQAVEILRLATREVSLPPALQGRESALKDLSFEYRLKD
ncbi:MAG: TonB family protein, partial [Burkholderiales bacterium]